MAENIIASGEREWIMQTARRYRREYPDLKFKTRKTKYIMSSLIGKPRRYEIITASKERYKYFI